MMRRTLLLPAAAVVTVAVALGLALLYAPTEALQGEVQRIFYVHVPSAWVAYLAFVVTAGASVLVLRTGDMRWDRAAVSSAELGVVFTTIVLVTGPIWGRRVWGVWWVWDARLTSTLVLWLVYVGYLLYRQLTPPGERRARTVAIIGIVGVVNIPVVHFSVVWWRTLHPLPTVLRPEQPELPGSMLLTLLVGVAAFTMLYAALLSLRLRIEGTRARVDRVERELADERVVRLGSGSSGTETGEVARG